MDRLRSADDVCANCRRDLGNWAKHVERQAALAKRGGTRKMVRLVEYPHWWPGFYYGGPHHHMEGLDETRRGVQELFDRIAKLVSDPVPNGWRVNSSEEAEALYHKQKIQDPQPSPGATYRPILDYPCSDGQSAEHYALVDRDLAEALQQLWDHVARFLHMSYLGGVEDGRNLLLQLVSGGMSTDKLAEVDMRRAKEMQTAKHLAKALKVKK